MDLGLPKLKPHAFFLLFSVDAKLTFSCGTIIIQDSPTSFSGKRTCSCVDWLQRSEGKRSRGRRRRAGSHGAPVPGHLCVEVRAGAGGEAVGGWIGRHFCKWVAEEMEYCINTVVNLKVEVTK